MIPFATTEHLILRPWKETDGDSLIGLFNDERVGHGITLSYYTPIPEALWEKMKLVLAKSFMVLVIEIKNEYLFMRGNDPREMDDERDSEARKRQKRKFVGFVSLDLAEPKNRDTEFSIALAFAWWSKGLGTEILQWLFRYNFEMLGMHRLTLHAFGDNQRAIELYKYLGFVEEGKMREAVQHEARWIDLVIMGMLDREWRAKTIQPAELSSCDDAVVQSLFRLKL